MSAMTAEDALIEDGTLAAKLDERYARWDDGLGREILDGTHDLASLATLVESRAIDPKPVSGRQELLENVVNRVTARLA